LAKTKINFLVDQNQIVLSYKELMHTFVFDNYEIVNGVICNQTWVVNVIRHYLYQNKLTRLAGLVVFKESMLQEKVVAQADLHIDLTGKLYVKKALDKDLHYLATIEPGILLQYQILFWRIGMYIESFTTGKM